MPNKSETIICSNPRCRKKIEEPILLKDSSTTPAKKYYACPHCFIKIDMPSTKPQKKGEEKKKKEELLGKLDEEKGPSRCAGYLGYLATRPKNASIPKECLTCPKVLDCVMKINDS